MDKQKKKKSEDKGRKMRLNLLFFIIFILFSSLIVRLGVVQIVQGETYRKEVSRLESNIVKMPAPRGKMFDRNGKLLVDNKGAKAVSYIAKKETKVEEKLKVAHKLAQLIDIPTDRIRDRDIKDYYLAAYPKEALKLLSEKEKTLTAKETYPLQIERISEQIIEEIKKNEIEEVAIYKNMTSGYLYETQIVKSGLKEEEMARIAENLYDLPGVDLLSDWERSYPYKEMLLPVLGGVTSEKQGILDERRDYYLSRDYSRNDRVGKSYLEYQYEDVLNPKKAKIEYISDRKGNTIQQNQISEGSRGYDLRLTVNADLQKEVEKILDEELRAAKGQGNYLLDRGFVVMMDPNNGDVYSIAGKMADVKKPGKWLDYSVGNFTSQYEIGSTIKGATILAGYQTGAISHNTVMYDTPILLAGAKPKKSWKNFGSINDLTALKVSSNVYMFRTVMNMAGVNYIPNGGLSVQDEDFFLLRNIYKQFGLGVETGIDLPNESKGLQGDPDNPGLLLDMSIGQYDTYTPVQMAQYVSVIANGGYRVRPHLVKSIHEPLMEKEIGPVVSEIETGVLNRIHNPEEDIERVQQGFKLVTSAPNGTANGAFAPHDVAGKTGTAQTFYYGGNRDRWGTPTFNLTFVGYYPSKNPKVAFSVVVPWVQNDRWPVNKNIAKRIIDAFVKYEENGGKSADKPE